MLYYRLELGMVIELKIDLTAAQANFTEIYKEFGGWVYNFTYSRTGNVAVAEDLTAEVFTNAWRSYASGGYEDQGKPLAWLLVMARHKVVDYHRLQKEEYLTDDQGHLKSFVGLDSADWDDKIEKSEQTQGLIQAVQRLTPVHRRVIVGRFIQEKPFSQIAQELGHAKSNTVRVIQHRALVRLRKILKPNPIQL